MQHQNGQFMELSDADPGKYRRGWGAASKPGKLVKSRILSPQLPGAAFKNIDTQAPLSRILLFLKIFIFSIVADVQCSANFCRTAERPVILIIHVYILSLTLSSTVLHHRW